jgi:hypothetical protein
MSGTLRLEDFFTNVFPKAMNTEYATKVVSHEFKSLKHYTKFPKFRLQNIPIRINEINMRVYGLEVKETLLNL